MVMAQLAFICYCVSLAAQICKNFYACSPTGRPLALTLGGPLAIDQSGKGSRGAVTSFMSFSVY